MKLDPLRIHIVVQYFGNVHNLNLFVTAGKTAGDVHQARGIG